MEYRDLGYNFLLGIDDPLDNEDGINTRNADQIFEAGTVEFNYTSMDTLKDNQNMESENFITGSRGWKIYGDGFAEFFGLTIIGGLINYNKTSFADSVNSGYYICSDGVYFGSASDATKLKFTISTGVLDFIGNVSGRSSATIASAINSSGQATDITNYLVTEVKLATDAVSSLKLQTGCVSELKIANDAVTAAKLNVAAVDGVTGDLVANSVGSTQISDNAVISQKIVANAITAGKIDANAVTAVKIEAGAITAIKIATDAITSDKIFAGAVIAGKIGALAVDTNELAARAVTAAKILAGTITTTELNATAINGMTITGATIQTAFPGSQAMVLNSSNITGYASGGFDVSHKRMQMDYDSLEFYNSSGLRTSTLDSSGILVYFPTDQTTRLNLWTDNSYSYIDAGASTLYGLVIRALHNSNAPIALFRHDGANSLLQMQGASNRIEANWFKADASGYFNFGATVGTSGYGIRDNSGSIEYKNSGGSWTSFPTGGAGTVTSIATSGAITGGTITTSGTIAHSTANGYVHIPSNGSSDQLLVYSSAGTAAWSGTPVVTSIRATTFDVAGLGAITWSSSRFNFNATVYTTGDFSCGGNVVVVDGNDLNFGGTNSRIYFGSYGYAPFLLNYKDHAGANQSKYILAQV